MELLGNVVLDLGLQDVIDEPAPVRDEDRDVNRDDERQGKEYGSLRQVAGKAQGRSTPLIYRYTEWSL